MDEITPVLYWSLIKYLNNRIKNIPNPKDAINNNPNNRLTLPEDVAKAVVTIGLSNDNWMTGNVIRLDGGEDITS